MQVLVSLQREPFHCQGHPRAGLVRLRAATALLGALFTHTTAGVRAPAERRKRSRQMFVDIKAAIS